MMKHIAFAILAVAIFHINPTQAAINVCSNVTNGVFLANLTDCNKYLVCWDQVAYDGACPDGLYFSAKTQKCDYANVTECVQTCNSSLSTFAYDKTCTKYVLCFDSIPLVQSCCDNLQYNSLTDRCDLPKNVDCQANLCTAINDPDNIVYLPSHTSCLTYYICYNGIAVQKQCATGLVFNTNTNCCDYKANFNCTEPAKTRSMLPYSKVPPTRANIDCPRVGSQFYPHATDPSSYYFCQNGKGVVLTCSPGLVYDETVEGCREPTNVRK